MLKLYKKKQIQGVTEYKLQIYFHPSLYVSHIIVSRKWIGNDFSYVYFIIDVDDSVRVVAIVDRRRKVSRDNDFLSDFAFTPLVVVILRSTVGEMWSALRCR